MRPAGKRDEGMMHTTEMKLQELLRALVGLVEEVTAKVKQMRW